jgi:hypothetical protein
MKKLFVITGLIFIGMALNAQVYMGLRFDVNVDNVSDNDGEKRTTDLKFGLYDEIGFRLTDIWDIGMEFGGMIGTYKNHYSDYESTSAHWLFSPYTRCSIVKYGNFDVKAKGSFSFEGTKDFFQGGVQMVPMLIYSLSDHIDLQTNLNFFKCGFYYTKIKDGNLTTKFGFGGNSNDLATLGSLSIGFVYKF